MDCTEFISYSQMEEFLRAHPASDPAEACAEAIRHFRANGLPGTIGPAIPLDCDIITTPDEDFIAMCDRLPISPLFLEDSRSLTSAALFPPNYDCFVVRHLNALSADVHQHDFFEICYVWSGGCTQVSANQTFLMEPGDFLIIPQGTAHKVEVNGPDTILFNIMVRRQAFLSSSFALLSQNFTISAFLSHCLLEPGQESCLLIHTDNGPIPKRILKHLTHECYIKQEFFCDFAINVFNQLFCYMLLNGEVRAKHLRLPDNSSLIAVLHEIQQNYRTITLKSLADKFFFSEEHLSRLIKKTTGKNFSELLRETRINQAKYLISRTELSIEQVSELVGYSDASSFTKAFKTSLGLSPAQYRRQHDA